MDQRTRGYRFKILRSKAKIGYFSLKVQKGFGVGQTEMEDLEVCNVLFSPMGLTAVVHLAEGGAKDSAPPRAVDG